MKNVVALMTDFGLKDNFVGLLKAVMTRINPGIKTIDITHDIARHNIKEAAFLLAHSFSYFPKGTIFLAVVDPGVGSLRRAIAIQTMHYYFIGPDNGILSIAVRKAGIKKIVALENKRYFLPHVSSTFHGRDIFAPVAAHISCGVGIMKLGRPLKAIETLKLSSVQVKGSTLEAHIVYVDTFGNLVTDVTEKQIIAFCKGKKFVALLNGKKISKISLSYSQGPAQEPFFIQGSFATLEVALKNRSAAHYFSLKNYGTITIRCRD